MKKIPSIKEVVEQCNNQIFNIMKTRIDYTIKQSDINNLDSLDKLVAVNETIESVLRELAWVMGYIPNPNMPFDTSILPVSDELLNKIYTYIEPLNIEADKIIQEEASKILESDTIEDLEVNYSNFQEFIKRRKLKDKPELYQYIKIKKTRII